MKRFLILWAPLALFACAQDSSDNAFEASLPPVDFDTAMANADAEAGQRLYLFCQSCHTLGEGGLNKVGPNLHDFYGKVAGQAEGFIYSNALMDANVTWDAETLDRWIANPSTAIPGTTMIFAGIRDQQQRADLIAYLERATTPD